VEHALEVGASQVEVTAEAEQAWLDLLLTGPGTMFGNTECTPGYYNNEGMPDAESGQWLRGYPAGAMAFFQYIDQWRSSGEFEGLELR
jgi:hypothetical protein